MHPAFVQGYADVMTKFAEISEEDIAAGLAGSTGREITPEEVEEYARQLGRAGYTRAKNRPAWGAGIGGALGGGLGALMTHGIRGGAPVMGNIPAAAAGGALGALGGGGLGYLIGRLSRTARARYDKAWGEELGNIAREGRVPRELNEYEHGRDLRDLVPYARGIQEATANPLTRDEYAMIRSGLMDELMKERGIEGALGGAAMRRLGNTVEGTLGGAAMHQLGNTDELAGAALGGGKGVLSGMREARSRANILSDLYERGYGHLAGRLYEEG